MRKIIIVLMCIGILVSWQICQSDLANAGSKGRKCSIAGVWEYTALIPDGEEKGFIIFTPLDPAGKRFAITVGDTEYFDPTYGGGFPEGTQASLVYGYAERKTPGFYDSSIKVYGLLEGLDIPVWKTVSRSEIKMVDCDHAVMRSVLEFFVYFEGDLVPYECVPYTATFERVTLTPPCGEFPPWPDGDDDDDDDN